MEFRVYDATGTVNITSEHLFSWNFKGVNCATEDYSVGNVSSIDYEIETDLEIHMTSPNHAVQGWIGDMSGDADFQGILVSVERVQNTKNHFVLHCTGDTGLDAIIPDAQLEPVEGETLGALVNRLSIYRRANAGANANYVINPKWGYSGVTYRTVARWVNQLGAMNCGGCIPPYSTIGAYEQVNWFDPTTVVVPFEFTPRNVKTITKADYKTRVIDKVWFGNDESDVGLSYGTGTQALLVPTNPLINFEDTSFLQPIYDKVHALISYTPMKITTFYDANIASFLIHNKGYSSDAHYWMTYTEDGVTYDCPIFNWEMSPLGIILEGTGSSNRTSTNGYLSSELQNAGKFNRFTRTLDETKSEVGNLSGQVSTLSQTAASLTLEVANKVDEDEIISKINQTAETITIQANRVNLNGYVEFSDLSTSGNTSINGDNLVTGIIKDTQNKNSWNLNTGAFTLTDGSVNIHTSAETNDIIELSANVRQTSATPVTGTVSANMQPTQFEIVRDATTNGRSRSVTTARMSADSSQPMLGLLYNAYDSNNQLTRRRNTAIKNGSMFISDYFPSQYGNVTPSAELQPDGLSFALGGEYTTYPNVCRLTGFTKYSSRLTALAGGACIIGPLVIISLRFDSAYTATNSPLIGTIASDMVPSYVSALSCIDVTNGIANEITEAIPCGINTDGKIYMKKMTNAHTYVITGCYPYQPL